jgi:hypothetical protein
MSEFIVWSLSQPAWMRIVIDSIQRQPPCNALLHLDSGILQVILE